MAEGIVPGDVVRLKSGGPKMTVVAVDVAEITEELSVWCEWFDEDKVAKSATFSMIAVEKWPPSGTPKVLRHNPAGRNSWMGN